jgi:hypothetical protein
MMVKIMQQNGLPAMIDNVEFVDFRRQGDLLFAHMRMRARTVPWLWRVLNLPIRRTIDNGATFMARVWTEAYIIEGGKTVDHFSAPQ